MEKLLENKLVWIAAILAVFIFGLLIGGKILANRVESEILQSEEFKAKVVDQAANEVIDRLQKDYAPGPYHPGFDPNKVNSNFGAPATQSQPKVQLQVNSTAMRSPSQKNTDFTVMTMSNTWDNSWEALRY